MNTYAISGLNKIDLFLKFELYVHSRDMEKVINDLANLDINKKKRVLQRENDGRNSRSVMRRRQNFKIDRRRWKERMYELFGTDSEGDDDEIYSQTIYITEEEEDDFRAIANRFAKIDIR